VAFKSIQPYLSGINAVFTDLGLEQPAKGPVVTRVRQGLERMQVDTRPAPRTLALPAAVAKRMLDAAVRLGTAGSCSPAELKLLRSLLFCIIAFLTASRPVSIVSLPADSGLLLDLRAAAGMVVYREYTKTARTADQAVPGRMALSFPTAQFAALINVLQRFARWRAAALPGAAFFFQLPGDVLRPSAEQNGVLASGWFDDALAAVPDRPPAGAVWTPRSLRSGAASAAEAERVPRSKTEYLGGWVPGSTALAQHYIDPCVLPSPAGEFFFGHLTR